MFSSLSIDKKKGAMISFVGGGGKTSTMFALANYLKKFGSVLITTTTKIFMPNSNQYDNLINLETCKDINKYSGITLLAGGINSDNKVIGVESSLLDEIYIKGLFKFIIVECDGAKNMPIKAPNDGEPIIPLLTNINIGIVGIDSIGRPLSQVCFRQEIFKANILNCEYVSNEAIINLINSENGLFKNTPKKCKKYFVLNKCDSNEDKSLGENILKNVRCLSDVNKTFISSIHKGEFYHKGENILGIIMASGFSKRMGKNKLLMKIDNTSMIRRVAKEVSYSKIEDIVLVYSDENVKNEVVDLPINTSFNNSPESGQSMSIKIGLNSYEKEYDGYMFFVGDQPFIDSSTINNIINIFNENKNYIVIPEYNGKKGNPVIFPKYLKNQLLDINGDKGGRIVIEQCEKINKVAIKDIRCGIDIDTVDEFKLLGGMLDE